MDELDMNLADSEVGTIVLFFPEIQPTTPNAESDPKEKGAGQTVCCPALFGMGTLVTMNPSEMQANILRVLKPSQGTARPTGHKIERQRAIHKMTGRAVES